MLQIDNAMRSVVTKGVVSQMEGVKDVSPPEGMKYAPAILSLHPERMPLGLVSIGDDKSRVIRVAGEARNRYGNTVPVIAIARQAFAGNENVTDIILPASIERLAAGAFAGCINLRSITIPKKIKTIRAGTFAGCIRLENVYYEGSLEDWRKVNIVHGRYEVDFGPLIPGTPVQTVLAERQFSIPGNEALFSANLHFRCALKDKESEEERRNGYI